MPVGLQLIGPHDTDWQLLETAVWCEEKLQFKSHPPMLAE
jgi:Asp-tRNA(Asn)/Glu-tRNA(Gln) amidotransferase A subunit family amidase